MSHSVLDRADLSSFHHWCSLFDFLSDDNLSIVEFCVQQLTKLLFNNSIKNYPWTHNSLSLSTMMQKTLYIACLKSPNLGEFHLTRFFPGTKMVVSLGIGVLTIIYFHVKYRFYFNFRQSKNALKYVVSICKLKKCGF